MSPKAKNYVIIVLAAATLTASSIAWNQSRQLAALNADLLKASAEAAALKAKPAPVAASFSGPAARPQASATTAPEIDPAPPATDESAQARRRGGDRPNFTALMANPEFAKAMNVQQRAALDTRYADLFRKLNLPPAELEKFKDLLVERQSARMDVMLAAREGGMNARDNRDELRKLTDEAQAEVDANIKATLGEQVFNQYQTFEATQPQRTVVKQLNDRLGYSSTPLNSTQTDFLINALATTGAGNDSREPTWGAGPGGNRPVITDAVIQQAQSVLSPDQLAALKQFQVEQQAQQKVREFMRPPREQATK